MSTATRKHQARLRRHRRVRKRVWGAPQRPRLAVYRSNKHIYAQLVDDAGGRTLAAASSLDTDVRGAGGDKDKKDVAKAVGALLARRAKEAGIERVVFDRGGRLFHGRVRSLAEGAREEGLRI
ncbi:MAG: 50S ribosomal protein L18 [Actinomycetota bacterium]